jgi:hypothetical protein
MNAMAMEQHVFSFSLIIEGTTEQLLQFTVPPKSMEQHVLDTNAGEQLS